MILYFKLISKDLHMFLHMLNTLRVDLQYFIFHLLL